MPVASVLLPAEGPRRGSSRRRRARRLVVTVAVVLLGVTTAACSAASDGDVPPGTSAASPATAAPAATSPEPSPEPSPDPSPEASADTGAQALDLGALEQQRDARVGVHAVDTATGRSVGWRDDERFAYASTIKAFAAAAVLDRTDDAGLQEVVTWTADDLVAYSPVTEQHVGTGLPLADLAEAAVTTSDNTAANLLLDRVGGPAGLDAAMAGWGDDVMNVVRDEPDLNEARRGDDRDTSTPAALAASLRAVAVDDALEPTDRELLVGWLRASTTGLDLVRAVTADGWVVGDKTGTARYGTRNDVAVVWPPDGGAPVVLAVLSDHTTPDAEPDDALVAAAACEALVALDVPVREAGCGEPAGR